MGRAALDVGGVAADEDLERARARAAWPCRRPARRARGCRVRAPCARTRSATAGDDVDMSIHSAPSGRASSAPPAPSMTSSTAAGVGSMVMSTSAAARRGGGRAGEARAALERGGGARGVQVEHGEVEAGLGQPPAHRAAHVAESDERDALIAGLLHGAHRAGRTGSRARRAPPARRRPAARRPARCAAPSAWPHGCWRTRPARRPAAGFTHTAAMSASSATLPASMIPSATASATPAATPACAAPQVRSAWRAGLDGRLVDEQGGRLHGQPRLQHGDEGHVPGARRGQRRRPRRPGGAVARPQHDVDVGGVGAVADEGLTDQHLAHTHPPAHSCGSRRARAALRCRPRPREPRLRPCGRARPNHGCRT